jgi:hypothetical protein
MDDFEKEYFEKLKLLAADYSDKRRELAKSRIKMFVAALCRQLLDEGEKFDLIVAAGNSGLYMSTITKTVYEALGKELPKVITLPIVRYTPLPDGQLDLFDNSSLKSTLSGKLTDIPSRANVLFVDDEIMSALTLKVAMELVLGELPELEALRCVVIAENHFFEWHYPIPKVQINYFAYSRLIQGLNGNIGYFIPEELYSKIAAEIPDVKSYNHAMAIVVGGAIKRKDSSGMPIYDFIDSYQEAREPLLKELQELVNQGIEEYKSKTIKFRF